MNVCLISWTAESKMCIFRFTKDINVSFVAEKNYKFWNEKYDGIRIVSFDASVISYRKHEIDKFVIPCILHGNVLSSMYLPLKNYGIPDEDILYISSTLIINNATIDPSDLSLFCDRSELDRLELHINDHCNLRCAGCSMLAGLVDKEVFCDYELTEKALIKLKKVYNRILRIDIFGGEPLLNPDLHRYCGLIRKLYPDSNIFIVTNGTLLLSMNEDLLYSIKSKYVFFSITYYPLMDDVVNKVLYFCNENNIRYEISKRRSEFLKLYDFSGQQNCKENHFLCKRRLSIIALRENFLSSCYVPFALCYANTKYGIGYTKEDALIDLLANDYSSSGIMKKFLLPLNACRFCHCDLVPWHQADESLGLLEWSK